MENHGFEFFLQIFRMVRILFYVGESPPASVLIQIFQLLNDANTFLFLRTSSWGSSPCSTMMASILSVMMTTLGWVETSLTSSRSTWWPPWAASIPQYLNRISQTHDRRSHDSWHVTHSLLTYGTYIHDTWQYLAGFFVQTWWMAQTAHSWTASSCLGTNRGKKGLKDLWKVFCQFLFILR